ncbi:MAG: hypothetical protein H8D23_29135 [Candidatus Brocadiales bacterium]|nr:hypothetical protein [Candidatus Brocadiales bacterium]
MFIFNILLTVACIWLAMYLNYSFLRVARINNVRFKIFELRDKLAFLALRNKIDHTSSEYSTLIYLMNSSIHILNQFSFVDFMKFLVTFYSDKELQHKMDDIMDNLKHNDSTYREIVHNYFAIMHKMLDQHTRILRWFFVPALLIIFFPIKVWQEKVKDKSKLIDNINSQFEQRIQQAT